ncbi:MAG TPA: FHA domain-containing protein [Pyrinomonadaceae bacterium]|jgi:hypothetical protein
MSLELRNTTFIVTRDDKAEAAKTLVTEGLRIGRLPECDIVLNHPTVSRLHAGINELGGRFYIVNLSGSNATTLNGRVVPFDAADALAAGDILQLGPFFLLIEQASERLLKLRVSHQFALNVGEMEARQESEEKRQEEFTRARAEASSEVAGALKVFWDKRTREKAGRPTPLHPHHPPRLGKARFNWTPTRDLVRPWPFSVFIWGIIVVGALSAAAALKYKNAFAPAPLSAAHTRTQLALRPAIAREPNGDSCASCHAVGVSLANRTRMEENCAACHQAEGFAPAVTRSHREAGITCTVCHTEHRGDDFSPSMAALRSCAACHNDDNRKLYGGKSVHTAHGGTFGYPVASGVWKWPGLETEELALRPELAAQRSPTETEQQWRSKQFHALHLYRVRAVPGIEGVRDEDSKEHLKVLSCSSCHKSFAPIDRETPRTTCLKCHNGQFFERDFGPVSQAPSMSCISCHVQHAADAHRNSPLLSGANTPTGTQHSPGEP